MKNPSQIFLPTVPNTSPLFSSSSVLSARQIGERAVKSEDRVKTKSSQRSTEDAERSLDDELQPGLARTDASENEVWMVASAPTPTQSDATLVAQVADPVPSSKPTTPAKEPASSGGIGIGQVLAALGGVAVLGAAGGGGGGGGSSSSGSSETTSGSGTTTGGSSADTTPPLFSSIPSATVTENTAAGRAVYTAVATDSSAITYSLQNASSALSINPQTGVVTLNESPDYEVASRYSFTVVATDTANNRSQQEVTINVTDVDDASPVFSSGTSASVRENAAVGTVVYKAIAQDAQSSVTYSLQNASSALSINAQTGEVRLGESPNYENASQRNYTFTVVATDASGNAAQQTVTLQVSDVDESVPDTVAPVFADVSVAALPENSASNSVIYTAQATDDRSTVIYTLQTTGDLQSLLSIDQTTGAVRLTESPDYESRTGYALTIVATDAAGNDTTQEVFVPVSDLDELAPVFTSGATGSVQENTASGAVIYTASATDAGSAVTYRLQNAPTAVSINADSGQVTLNETPNFESTPAYAFTVLAQDAAGNQSSRSVTISVTDVDEVAPVFSSGAAVALPENVAAGDVVYTAVASDSSSVSYSLQNASTALSINAQTGAVTINVSPDYENEAQRSFPFTVVATDAANNQTPLAVTLSITDVDETRPTVVSTSPADAATAVSVTSPVKVTFSEAIQLGTGTITLSSARDVRTFTVGSDTDSGNLTVSGNELTIAPQYDWAGLADYTVSFSEGVVKDLAGNNAQIDTSNPINFSTAQNTHVVVFDLDQGKSSDHSNRTFDANTTYQIFMAWDGGSAAAPTFAEAQQWSGAANLGADDQLILVGSFQGYEATAGTLVTWGDAKSEAVVWQNGLRDLAYLTLDGVLMFRNSQGTAISAAAGAPKFVIRSIMNGVIPVTKLADNMTAATLVQPYLLYSQGLL